RVTCRHQFIRRPDVHSIRAVRLPKSDAKRKCRHYGKPQKINRPRAIWRERRLKHGCKFRSCRRLELERAMGIEPTCEAWKASVLPLNYARKSFIYADI